jgi:catabolite regulation protein CreA
MKIVILNDCFFKENHLASLKELGEVVEYNDTNSEQLVIERLKDADIGVADCYLSPLKKSVFDSMKYPAAETAGYRKTNYNNLSCISSGFIP